MKRIWTLRFRAVDKKNFLEIKRGLKKVETRAATEKYRAIKKGDVLKIVCGSAVLLKPVKRVRIFKSVDGMVKRVPYRRIMPEVASVAAMKKIYAGYPGYKEKLKKYGVIAFDL